MTTYCNTLFFKMIKFLLWNTSLQFLRDSKECLFNVNCTFSWSLNEIYSEWICKLLSEVKRNCSAPNQVTFVPNKKFGDVLSSISVFIILTLLMSQSPKRKETYLSISRNHCFTLLKLSVGNIWFNNVKVNTYTYQVVVVSELHIISPKSVMS